MNRPLCITSSNIRKSLIVLMCFLVLTGCRQSFPVYFRDVGDLSYFVDQQVDIAYPDVATETLPEVTQARQPWTLKDEDIVDFWELSLEDAISIALQNAKVIRGYGIPGLQNNLVAPGQNDLANGPGGASTIYNVAIRESEPGFLTTPGQPITASALATNTGLDSNQGVEAALAEFDAHFTTNIFWNNTDRPQNFAIAGLDARLFQDYNANFQAELTKKAATGTQYFFRNVTDYRRNNNPLIPAGGAQFYPSVYTTALEMEARQPLLRGRGTSINRMPVIFARIGGDQEVAAFETQIHNFLTNIEIQYWNLQCAYREFEASKQARESALEVFNIERAKFEIGSTERGRGGTKQTVAQAQEQYYFFRAEVQRSHSSLMDAESNLRWLLGIASTDSRFIRPSDEPTTAYVNFDWNSAVCQALSMRPTLRQERWEVKKKQLAIAYAKNSLLPQLNATALYRWVGIGDDLINANRSGNNFGNPLGATAWDVLTEGDFQEFRFGFEFGLPVGFRKELANVRNAQLKLARELAVLEDMELDTSRELAHAYRALETNYQLSVSNYNRWSSSEAEVASFDELQKSGQATVDLALDAQRRRAQAQVAYYRSVCEYNKTIALMHYRKGTTLDFYGVHLGEGPWPGKAYQDATEHARRRGASRQINYGFTRPGTVSIDGGLRGNDAREGFGETIVDGAPHIQGETIIQGQPVIQGEQINPVPTPNQNAPIEIAPPTDGVPDETPTAQAKPVTQASVLQSPTPARRPTAKPAVFLEKATFSDAPVGTAVLKKNSKVRQATARLKTRNEPTPAVRPESKSTTTRQKKKRRSRAVIRSLTDN